MKTATVVTAFVLFAHAAQADEAKPLALGATAPQITAKLKNPADGKTLTLAEAKGAKGTLVVFTCNNCPWAKAWEQRIVEMGNGYSKKGIGVVLVNSNDPSIAEKDTPDLIKARHKERAMAVPYVIDENQVLAKAFGATVTPEAFLFDKGGKLVYHGTIDDNGKQPDQVTKRYLKDALDAVSSGKAPAVGETKGIGCGIKFKKNS
jgi:peroxiredoxin